MVLLLRDLITVIFQMGCYGFCLISPCFFKKSNGDISNDSIRPSVYLSCYLLLNHWAEFYQNCYNTSPHGKGVREQYYFSICLSAYPSSVRLSIMLDLNCYTTLPHGTGMPEQHYWSIRPSRYLLLNHWAEFNQTYYIISPHRKDMQHYFSMHPFVYLSVTLSPPKPQGGI